MSCHKHDEEAHYHFTLTDVVEYAKMYGVDKVMTDIYDMLSEDCNRKVSQYEMELLP